MRTAVTLMMCVVLSACAISHKSHIDERGSSLRMEDIAQIRPGHTDREWLLEHLGTPDRIQSNKDGREVFEYVTERIEIAKTRLVYVISIESQKSKEKTTRIVLRNGIVESVDTLRS